MSATVIVPTYRGADRIGDLLDSLDTETAPHQVLVVDNGSTDGTRRVLSGYPGVDVIRLERNIGFGRAVNLAARRADGEELVLINDDCVCDPGFVEALTRPLDAEIVMSAGVLRDGTGDDLIDTAGMELTPTLLVFDYMHGLSLDAVQEAADPIGPSAAAAAFNRAAFVEAGGFDERLFAYWEDVDLVLRLRLAGGRCALAKDAQGTHLHSATLGAGSRRKNWLMGFGRAYVLRKWSVLERKKVLRVLGEDGVICLGQALVDGNVSGIAGRISGYRAAQPIPPYPRELLDQYASTSLRTELRRRLRRRRRIRRLRSESESTRRGLERQLSVSPKRKLCADEEGFAVELTTPPPPSVRIGEGNIVFLGGRMTLDLKRAPNVDMLVDGVPSSEPVTVVNPDGGGPAFWWTTLRLAASNGAQRQQVDIALRASGGDPPPVCELGSIEIAQVPTRAGDVDSRRLSAAFEAAGGEPLVAICMATYEPPADLFVEQLASIRNQTHQGWICVISDDGSSPEKLTAMREAIGGDPRFLLLSNQPRLGFYANFERALNAVPPEAELVALADQDDRWFPEKLEALIAGLGDRDLVYGDMRIVGRDGSVISDTYWNRRRNNYTDLASLLVGNTVTGAASLFRADLLDRALPFPPRRGDAYHDHWIALAAMTRNGLAYVDRPLQEYVQHGDAAQGHEEANAGARYLQLRMVAVLAWQAVWVLRGRFGVKGWAGRYFGMYLRTTIWAQVLIMRSGDSLAPRHRRVLQRIANADRSLLAFSWLSGRSLRPLWGANEAFGRELLVVTSVLWARALRIRVDRSARIKPVAGRGSRATP